MEKNLYCNVDRLGVERLKKTLDGNIRFYESLDENQKEEINVGDTIDDVRSYIRSLDKFIRWQDHYIKRLKAYIEEREEYTFNLENFINRDNIDWEYGACDIIREYEEKDNVFR